MTTVGLVVFVAAAGLLFVRRIEQAIWCLAIEGAALSAGVMLESPRLWPAAALAVLTLMVKAMGIPGLLHRVMARWPEAARRDRSLPWWAYPLAAVLVVAVGHVLQLLKPTGLVRNEVLFFYGLAAIHLGLLTTVSRRHLLSQACALIGVENGLVVLASSVAGSLPVVLEVGMLVDLMIAAAVLVWLSRQIHSRMRSTDVAALDRLRG